MRRCAVRAGKNARASEPTSQPVFAGGWISRQKIPDRIPAHGLQTVIWIHLVSIPTAGPRWIAAATTIASSQDALAAATARAPSAALWKNPFGAARRRPARLVRETMDDEFALFAAEIGQLEAAAKEKDAGDASPAEAPPPGPPPPPPPPAPPPRPRPPPRRRAPARRRSPRRRRRNPSKWAP